MGNRTTDTLPLVRVLPFTWKQGEGLTTFAKAVEKGVNDEIRALDTLTTQNRLVTVGTPYPLPNAQTGDVCMVIPYTVTEIGQASGTSIRGETLGSVGNGTAARELAGTGAR